MRRVLEDIEKRHCSQRELVDEDSLVFALDEMQNNHGHRKILRGG